MGICEINCTTSNLKRKIWVVRAISIENVILIVSVTFILVSIVASFGSLIINEIKDLRSLGQGAFVIIFVCLLVLMILPLTGGIVNKVIKVVFSTLFIILLISYIKRVSKDIHLSRKGTLELYVFHWRVPEQINLIVLYINLIFALMVILLIVIMILGGLNILNLG